MKINFKTVAMVIVGLIVAKKLFAPKLLAATASQGAPGTTQIAPE